MKKGITPEIETRLGTVPDSLLAREAGVDTESIRRLRMSRRIKATRTYVGWTAEMDALLGTDTDEAVALKLGVTRTACVLRRQRLGRPPLHPHKMKYMKGASTTGVVTLTGHVSEEVRLKAHALREPLLQLYQKSGLPMREVTMWQVMEYAVNKLHAELLPGTNK